MKVFYKMKLTACFLVAFIYTNILFSQQNHFIYIQSDDKQPFSVNVNEKTYSSSDIGYVIIPKLASSEHVLKIIFPGNKYPEQSFNCALNNTDAGYALKNYGEKGWGLFNFQTLELVMAGSAAKADSPKEPASNTFSEMLSEVADDTTLTIESVMAKEPEKKTEVPKKEEVVPNTDAHEAGISPAVVAPAVIVPVTADKARKENAKAGSVKKISEQSNEDNTEMVFTTKNGKKVDTIRIVVPLAKIPVPDTQKNEESRETTKTDTVKEPEATKSVVTKPEATETGKTNETVTEGGVNNPFYVPAAAAVNKSAESSNKPAPDNLDKSQPVNTAPEEKPSGIRECKKMLSENDFDRMKRKMFIEANDDKMIEVAKKNLQGKCVTTEQVKNLGILFPSDEGRFGFFNAAYPFVSDPAAYAALKSHLVDPEYKKRFDLTFSK